MLSNKKSHSAWNLNTKPNATMADMYACAGRASSLIDGKFLLSQTPGLMWSPDFPFPLIVLWVHRSSSCVNISFLLPAYSIIAIDVKKTMHQNPISRSKLYHYSSGLLTRLVTEIKSSQYRYRIQPSFCQFWISFQGLPQQKEISISGLYSKLMTSVGRSRITCSRFSSWSCSLVTKSQPFPCLFPIFFEQQILKFLAFVLRFSSALDQSHLPFQYTSDHLTIITIIR